jgi:hypothetical protein
MWLLKSANDRILGVDTLGQHVPPSVWYGADYRKVQEGPEGILLYPIRKNLSNCERGLRVFYCTQKRETYVKVRHKI